MEKVGGNNIIVSGRTPTKNFSWPRSYLPPAAVQMPSRVAIAPGCPKADSLHAWSNARRRTSSSVKACLGRKLQCSR